jgi:xanthine dehydrogenase accessory factor
MNELQAILHQLEREPDAPQALATLVHVEGSSYRRVGARLLVNMEGQWLGSISGGCLESDVIARAQEVLADGEAQLAVYDTTDENDLVWGTGTGCNGVVSILIERLPVRPTWVQTLRQNLAARKISALSTVWKSSDTKLLGTHESQSLKEPLSDGILVLEDHILPPVRLLVFGAGDDTQPLTKMAKELGWVVEVFDARPGYATKARFPGVDKVTAAQPENAASVPLDPWTVAVIMSHRYRDDVELVRALLPQALPYVGLLGPKLRAERILADLEKQGLTITEEMQERLHGPVGLDLGGQTRETVALSVLAEIQALFTGRNAQPLRLRNRPIHA